MIILDLEQGTPEWNLARLAIPTASMFSTIITPGGKPSTSAQTYMDQLLADWLAGYATDAWEGNKFTEDGKKREPEARALYELLTDTEVREVGFVYLDERRLIGCSPDGLVGDDGLVEFKNPKASTLVSYLRGADKVPTTYIPQVQGQLWVTGRQWCDFMFQHPALIEKRIRVYRDEPYIRTMAGMVEKFVSTMLEWRVKLEPVRQQIQEGSHG